MSRRWQERIVEYLYRELSPEEMKQFEEAMATDLDLRDETQALRASIDEMRRLEKAGNLPKCSSHVAERVMFAARTEADRNQKRAESVSPYAEFWRLLSRPAFAYGLTMLFVVGLSSYVLFQKYPIRIEVKHLELEAAAPEPMLRTVME